MTGAKNLFLYFILRPLVRFIPTAVLAALFRVVSVPLGLVRAVAQRVALERKLNLCGRTVGLWNCVTFSIQTAYEELRHLDFYLYGRTPRVRIDWPDEGLEKAACVYVTVNRFGSETIAGFMDRFPAVVMRGVFGGEDEFDVRTAPARVKWFAHVAAVRASVSRGRMVEVGGNPLKYRKILDGKTSLIIYQDVWDEKDTPPHFELLGQPTSLRLGAIRLSKIAGDLPIRFMSIEPRGGTWVITIGPRLPHDEQTLARLVDAEIRRHPAAWMRWPAFFDYLDGKRSRAATHSDEVSIRPDATSPRR